MEEKREQKDKNIKYTITKEIFDHLYDMLRHEDEKANRILGAMAFITVAAAALSIPFFEGKIGTGLKFFNLGLGLFLFFIFLILIAIGTLFLLSALGPLLHITTDFVEPSERKKKLRVRSLLYFENITGITIEEWTKFFRETDEDDFYEKICNDHIIKSYTLANRTKYKAKCIKSSKIFYRFSLIVLCLFVLSGFCVSFNSFFYWAFIILAAAFLEWSVEYYLMPQKELKKKAIPFIILAFLFALMSLIFFNSCLY